MGSTLRNSRPTTFRPVGVSDAPDGTNAFPGAMQNLVNLIPSPSGRGLHVPRPGAQQLTAFAGVGNTPTQLNALLTVGSIAYGMYAETAGGNAGLDVPFAYNFISNTFLTIANPGGTAALPTSPASSGDWQPPIMQQVGSRIVICHPGYAGGLGPYFGWLDISGFTDNTHTGNTHSNKTIDTLSANVLTAGWQVGMTITGSGIPANTTITSIASNGLSLTISNNASSTSTGVTLTVAGGTKTAPLYASGNTNGGIQLASPPVAVAQYNGRAWFAVGSAIVFSDSGLACQVTNATQALTFQNGLPVTAVVGLPLQSPLTGGMIQSLMAFQGDNNIIQISGDQATSNLTTNDLNVATGTLAPLTIAPTTRGIAFVAPDGVRIIDFNANISEPLGAHGDGISVPFQNAKNPSRMAAAFNQNVLRISVTNSLLAGPPTQEYWYDFELEAWSGPHTFPAAMIQPMQGSTNSFIMAGWGINAKLWQSDVLPTKSTSYVENGATLTWIWQTTLLPDNEEMCANAIVESAIMIDVSNVPFITIQALDELNNVLDTVTLSGSSTPQSIWGVFTWGQSWDGAAYLFQQALNWHLPLVFKQMSIRMSGTASAGAAIGNLYLRTERLNYLLPR